MLRKPLVLAASIAIALCSSVTLVLGQSANVKHFHRFQLKKAPPIVHGPMSREERKYSVANTPSGSNQLPVWNYEVVASRDGNLYEGVIVGRNPNESGTNAAASVPAQVIPLILKFHRIGTAVDLNTGVITTTNGNRSSDPTVADTGCFAGSANVPLQVMAQSPVLNNADFNFGGTDVGTDRSRGQLGTPRACQSEDDQNQSHRA